MVRLPTTGTPLVKLSGEGNNVKLIRMLRVATRHLLGHHRAFDVGVRVLKEGRHGNVYFKTGLVY